MSGAITFVQVLYAVLAILSGFLFALAILGVMAYSARAPQFTPPAGIPTIVAVMLIVTAIQTILYAIGAFKVRSAPMPWAVLIATLQALGAIPAAIALLGGQINLGIALYIALAVACWVAVGMIGSAGGAAHRRERSVPGRRAAGRGAVRERGYRPSRGLHR